MKQALVIVFGFFLFIISAKSIRATTASTKADTVAFTPHMAPPFELKDLDGKVVHLADFAGKVVVLDFFATWCPPCRWEIPQFNELQKKYTAQGVQFVGISLDEEGAEKVKAWMMTHPVAYPIVMTDPDRKILDTYNVKSAIPVTYVIDRKGMIRYEYVPRPGDKPGVILDGMLTPLISDH